MITYKEYLSEVKLSIYLGKRFKKDFLSDKDVPIQPKNDINYIEIFTYLLLEKKAMLEVIRIFFYTYYEYIYDCNCYTLEKDKEENCLRDIEHTMYLCDKEIENSCNEKREINTWGTLREWHNKLINGYQKNNDYKDIYIKSIDYMIIKGYIG